MPRLTVCLTALLGLASFALAEKHVFHKSKPQKSSSDDKPSAENGYACSSDDVCQQPCQDVQIPEFVSFITGHCISGFCDCLFDSDDACKGACSAYYAKKYPDATLLKACRDGRGETCTCKVDCGKADPQCKAMDGEDPSYANCD